MIAVDNARLTLVGNINQNNAYFEFICNFTVLINICVKCDIEIICVYRI